MIRNLTGGAWAFLFVLAALIAARPAAADLIGSDLESADAASAAASPASPVAAPAAVAPSDASVGAIRGQLRSIGLSSAEVEQRVSQLNESELQALCRDPQQMQVAGGFQVLGIEAGAAVVIFLVVAVIAGLWWWFGE